jgi:DNA polymerase III delta subunit
MRKATEKTTLTVNALMARAKWGKVPAAIVLAGPADFLKKRFLDRLASELSAKGAPEITRFQGPPGEKQIADLPLAAVLDELRTPSFFSPERLVILERADAFLAAHGDALVPFLDAGFGGGRLAALTDEKLDGRRRFAKALAEKAWIVECPQPYDRPPPWESGTPAWDSDLSRWVVAHAAEKGLTIDPRTAFLLHERVGTDLGVIDEELEKLSTFLASKGRKDIDAEAISAIAGDLREDSVFHLIDLFLEGRRPEALDAAQRLLRKGYHTERGSLTIDPASIALLFTGALVPRLRALRRAHALSAEGAGPEEWIRLGLVLKPFLPRFRRALQATPPARIARVLDALYDLDKGIKTGKDPEALLEVLVAELGAGPAAPARTGPLS